MLGQRLGTDLSGSQTLLSRRDGRLAIDPGVIVKSFASRIEVGLGADLIAEGRDGERVVFTSRGDDEYGAGGTFDTDGNGASTGLPGQWGGILFRQDAFGSLDRVDIRFGGGDAPAVGVQAAFNAIEMFQADVRLTNSRLLRNADGFDPATTINRTRAGRGANDAASIFIVGSQPIIVGNTIARGEGAAISINPDALSGRSNIDHGRVTGPVEQLSIRTDNQGPLIEENRLGLNAIDGLVVRGEIVTGNSTWDDTSIVHVVQEPILSLTNAYTGGIRLVSDADRSLVVKFGPAGTLVADGRPLDIDDRIGGTLQVLGAPAFPVILTSINDNSVGSGFTFDGRSATQTIPGNTTAPAAGDWPGLVIGDYANDRNVAILYENERPEPADEGANAAATGAELESVAQRLGQIARRPYSGNETDRLGLVVRGLLTSGTDRDIYQFFGTGGTPVTIDVDTDRFGVDVLLELINSEGQVIATSDNSFAEANASPDSTLSRNLTAALELPQEDLRPVATTLQSGNSESPNRFDAAMRVVLPGNEELTRYFVRVRAADNNGDGIGDTAGQYELQIRLRDEQETPGSVITGSVIRYATTAITVPGAPLHSPLIGTVNEPVDVARDPDGIRDSGDELLVESVGGRLNGSRDSAIALGNLMTSDRGSLVVSGSIGNLAANTPSGLLDADFGGEDVDVYRVDLFAQQLSPNVFDNEQRYVTTTFDIDYADGIERVNTHLNVFDSNGRLILTSRDSNVADDVGRPTRGVDSANLQSGSAGIRDAFIGPVELLEGTYFVTVSSELATPQTLDQFFEPNPTTADVRVYPLDSVRRISEDGFDADSLRAFDYAAERPVIEANFSEDSAVPYTLADVGLYVIFDQPFRDPSTNSSTFTQFNPFTGTITRRIGVLPQGTEDLILRRDGELVFYNTPPAGANAGNTGNYFNISPVNAATNSLGDDGITFRRNNQNGDNTENDPNGLFIAQAIAEIPAAGNLTTIPTINNEEIFVVGRRTSSGRGEVPIQLRTNILYDAREAGDTIGNDVVNPGQIISRGIDDADFDNQFQGTFPYSPSFGPASDEREYGIIDTGFITDQRTGVLLNPGGDGGNVTGLAIARGPVAGGSPSGNGTSAPNLLAVTDGGGIHVVNPRVLASAAFGPLPQDVYSRILVTNNLGRLEPDPDHNVAFPTFTSLSYGPQSVEGNRFANTLFAATPDGWLYAFTIGTDPTTGQLQPQPANVFFGGRSAVELSFLNFSQTGPGISVAEEGLMGSPVGIAFSNLQFNPWQETSQAPFTTGQGIVETFNRSRGDDTTAGNSSLYFGFELQQGIADNTIASPDAQIGQLAPGVVQGQLLSQSMDLSEYSAGDRPTLYFSYIANIEADDDFRNIITPGRPAQPQQDSLRVFAAGDDGQFQLLATNNSFRDVVNPDEFDTFSQSGIVVQEIFDDEADTQFRQVRVDLSPFAGSRDVRIRFDFSTAGAIREAFGSIELIGRDGVTIPDGSVTQLVAINGQDDNETFFDPFGNDRADQGVAVEAIVGRDVILPSGNFLTDGDSFSVTAANGIITIVEFDNDGMTAGNAVSVAFDPTTPAAEIVRRTAAALPQSLGAQAIGNRLNLLAATNVSVDDAILAGQSNPIEFSGFRNRVAVPNGDRAVVNETLTVTSQSGATQTFEFVRSVTEVSTPGATPILFAAGEPSATIAARIVAALTVTSGFVNADGDLVLDQFANGSVSAAPTAITIAPASSDPTVASATNINLFPDDRATDPASAIDASSLNNNQLFVIPAAVGQPPLTIGLDEDGDGQVLGENGQPVVVDVVLDFSDTDTVDDLNIALRDAINTARPAFAAAIVPGPFPGTERLVVQSFFDANDAPGAVTIRDNQFDATTTSAVIFEFPDGPNLTSGSRVDLAIAGRNASVVFSAGNVGGATTGTLRSVRYDGIQDPAFSNGSDIAQAFRDALLADTNLPTDLTINVQGNRAIVYNASIDPDTGVSTPQIAFAQTQATRVVIPTAPGVPSGSLLNDRDLLQFATAAVAFDTNSIIGNLAGAVTVTLRANPDANQPGDNIGVTNPRFFDASDTADEIRTLLQVRTTAQAVPGTADEFFVLAGGLIATEPAEAATVSLADSAGTGVTLPSGADLRTGETLRLTLDPAGPPIDIIFYREGTARPATLPRQFAVAFGETTPPDELGRRIVGALVTAGQSADVFQARDFGFVILDNNSAASVTVNPAITVIQSTTRNSFAIPLTLPGGDQLRDGDSLLVFRNTIANDQVGLDFTFVTAATATGAAGEIVFDPADSPQEVADAALAAFGRFPELFAQRLGGTGRVLALGGAASVRVSLAADGPTPRTSVPIVTFTAAEVNGLDPSGDTVIATPLLINATFDSVAVAEALRTSLSRSVGTLSSRTGGFLFEQSTADLFRVVGGDRIQLPGINIVDPGALGSLTNLPGEAFGVNVAQPFSNGVQTVDATDNAVNGIFIDDIVVGFAERGEIVVYDNYFSEPANTNFVIKPEFLPEGRIERPASPGNNFRGQQPEMPDETLVGAYTLEIRTADEYGVPDDLLPEGLRINEQESLGRSFDTNDRLADGAVSIIAPPGTLILDGDTFTIDDGTDRLTFEFNSILDMRGFDSTLTGNVPVPFNPVDINPASVATAIRNAINSPQAQDALRVLAGGGDSSDLFEVDATSRRVELFARDQFARIIVNPGSGRNITLDMNAAETPFGRETSKRIAVIDQDAGTVQYVVYGDELARAAVVNYVPGDTLFAVGKLGDQVNIGDFTQGFGDDGAVLGDAPSNDFDVIRIFLEKDSQISLDLDTVDFTRAGVPVGNPTLSIFPAGAEIGNRDPQSLNRNAQLAFAFVNPLEARPGETDLSVSIDAFNAPASGYYNIVINNFSQIPGDYALTIRPLSDVQAVTVDGDPIVDPVTGRPLLRRDVLTVDYQFGKTDINRLADQGQLIVAGNIIRDSAQIGINASIGARGQALASTGLNYTTGFPTGVTPDGFTRPGAARTLRNVNPDGLIRGTVISNNIVENSGTTGILIGGGTFADGQIPAPSLFSRVVNNTVVNQAAPGTGSGIAVTGRAAPLCSTTSLSDSPPAWTSIRPPPDRPKRRSTS